MPGSSRRGDAIRFLGHGRHCKQQSVKSCERVAFPKIAPEGTSFEDIAAIRRQAGNLIKPPWMLSEGGDTDEENQDSDDVGLEPQDRVGVHGKVSTFFRSGEGTGLGRR